MLRHKPRLTYCGLTVVLSNPSRFDKLNLLSASGGVFFNDCLRPEFNQMQCDIRLAEDTSPFLDKTKCVLLLGQTAMHRACADTGMNTLNEMRGSPLSVKNIPALASYLPQDCADIKNYELTHNPLSAGYDDGIDQDDEDGGDVKRFSNTKRANYSFWLKKDVEKCKKLLLSKQTTWPIEQQPIYKIYPPADEVINVLNNAHDIYLDFDMETDWTDQNMLCFSFSVDDGKTVYAVPTLNQDYRWAYSALPFIIQSLIRSIRNNILVAHNGSGFDFIVLGYKYKIPVYRCYDTMLAMHRCFPDIEKSLGHCTSLWTYQRFHKDTSAHGYRTQEDVMRELKYCAKDVFTMSLIRKAITKYASSIVGLSESICCAQRSIRPYLITTLQGIRYSKEKVDKLTDENDRLMMQYLKIIEILIGPVGMDHCRKAIKSKNARALPGSNPQCCDYFHEQLGYPVVARSKETGKPSLGKKAIYKLALEHSNPVITFIMLYRQTQKETSKLMFHPWKDDDGNILPRIKPVESFI